MTPTATPGIANACMPCMIVRSSSRNIASSFWFARAARALLQAAAIPAVKALRDIIPAIPGMFLSGLWRFRAISGGIGHKLRHPLANRPWLFRRSRSRPPSRTIIAPQDRAHGLFGPQQPPDGGEGVGERRVRVLVPGRAKDRELAGLR